MQVCNLLKVKMKYLFLGLAITLFSSCATTQTFYIVRHAEKENNSDEAGLSQAGIERGIALEKYMAGKKLDTVFTSGLRRAVLTGLSVSLPQGLPHITNSQKIPDGLNGFIERLRKIGSTKNILVVGHSNTVPVIVQSLSGQAIAPIPETEYNNIYRVVIKGKEKTMEHTKYGN